jgi:hypothetical protein
MQTKVPSGFVWIASSLRSLAMTESDAHASPASFSPIGTAT